MSRVGLFPIDLHHSQYFPFGSIVAHFVCPSIDNYRDNNSTITSVNDQWSMIIIKPLLHDKLFLPLIRITQTSHNYGNNEANQTVKRDRNQPKPNIRRIKRKIVSMHMRFKSLDDIVCSHWTRFLSVERFNEFELIDFMSSFSSFTSISFSFPFIFSLLLCYTHTVCSSSFYQSILFTLSPSHRDGSTNKSNSHKNRLTDESSSMLCVWP